MKIAPCFVAPLGAKIVSMGEGLTMPLHYLIAIVEFDEGEPITTDPHHPIFANFCRNYSVNIYEPSSATPVAVNFDASFVTMASGKVNVSGFSVYLGVGFITRAQAGAILSASRDVTTTANFATATAARANLTGFPINFTASFYTSAAAISHLSGSAVALYANFFTSAVTTSRLTGATITLSASLFTSAIAAAAIHGVAVELDMNLHDVVTEQLNLWGIESICLAPDFALERAISDVNSAMQIVWNQANDRNYWSKSTLSITLTSGQDALILPSDVQNVVGPCRLDANKRLLAPIGSISELENFINYYLDGRTPVEPVAYHIERSNQTGNDPAKCVFRVTPPVAVGETLIFLLDVVKEAPRFNVKQLSVRPTLPIPHRYVESILLPILRYRATSFWLFSNNESKPTIDRDYQSAMLAIGSADPLPGKSGDNKETSKK
jgi:hypothetical protein